MTLFTLSTHLIALFAGFFLGFLCCALVASRTRSHNLDEIDDEELLKQLTGDDDPRYYDQTCTGHKKGAQ